MTPKTITRKTKQITSSEAENPSPEVSLPTPANPAVPADHEAWLYNNPEALADVKRGLADSAAGRGVKMSFLEFADLDIDD